MEDGYRLPVRHWGNAIDSKAIVLAVHGLNDYSFGFDSTGSYLAEQGVSLVTYDQRGFGATEGHGYWHGSQRMIDDSHTILRLLRDKFPEKPLFLLGESMGGAVVLATLAQEADEVNERISGIILIAPAIWSRQTMPWYQRALLWLAVHTVPAKKLTGDGLDLMPSDNIEMLRAMGQDPLVLKATRVDVLYGVTNLMDLATEASTEFTQTSLILYGKHDQIVPRDPTCQWLHKLPDLSLKQREIIIYENGYHMLNRDLQAKQVLDDIANWVKIRSGQKIVLLASEIKPVNLQDNDKAFRDFCNMQEQLD
jgi:alpha-beta hydrolase superfamily lysophospholipase